MMRQTKDIEQKSSALQARFAGKVTLATDKEQLVITVNPPDLPDVLRFLRDAEGFKMDYLGDLTAVDYPEHFTVVYQLYSIALQQSVVVKVNLDKQKPVVASATPVWKGANWLEREVYDMFGIEFSGHPYLERILTAEGFEGYPLRKDFKLPDRSERRAVR